MNFSVLLHTDLAVSVKISNLRHTVLLIPISTENIYLFIYYCSILFIAADIYSVR